MHFIGLYLIIIVVIQISTTSTTSSDEQQDRDKLQEGTLEFIEAWLNLIQKLVNTKNMLETRHSLGPAANTTYTNPPASGVDIKKVCSFDPIKSFFLKYTNINTVAPSSFTNNEQTSISSPTISY